MGLHFEDCNAGGLSLRMENCNLMHATFYKCRLQKSVFNGCNMTHADFTDAGLTGAPLTQCDLTDAKFENTNLENADLRGSVNYLVDPELNRIRKARFSLDGLPGLLTRYNISVE